MANQTTFESNRANDFIREIVGKYNPEKSEHSKIITRFPPEPNGYLHIGHAKSAWINFGIANENGGICNLRFDDTNPGKEDSEYVESIQNDLRWLGFNWGNNLYFSSDYFEKMYEFAIRLINKGKAYVCDLNQDQIREYRGTLTSPGKESPFRKRTVEENLDLFTKMRHGEFAEGERVLRAKIDMTSGNINMRDPVIYRIMKIHHERTDDKWCIYPTYDFAHGQSDSIEGVTHSICTLEFEDHRPLYDWLLEELEIYHPQQIEFARLNLSHTVMSKRKLLELVEQKYVSGWNDPRMPTISGLRRRGYTPKSIKDFCERIGVAKRNNTVEYSLLEHCIREELNTTSQRVMGILRPLKVVIDNYPENQIEHLDAVNNPENPDMGTRQLPFSREIYIEKEDFMENPPKKFYRLSPGNEVRLRYGYFIKCVKVVKDLKTGDISELHCTYDPKTRGGQAPDKRKVKGTIHWVSAQHAIEAEIHLYEHLFTTEKPESDEDGSEFKDHLNPNSMITLKSCKLEPSLANAKVGENYQFERQGYFCIDQTDSSNENMIFNRTVSLRDSWAKMYKTQTSD